MNADSRVTILPILTGDGIPFFEKLDRDVALHLAEVKAYKSGMVALCYQVRGDRDEPRTAPPNQSLEPTADRLRNYKGEIRK